MIRQVCYYAHSMLIFDSDQEIRDVTILERIGFDVLNPNQKQHSDGYYRDGMDYFEDIIKDCDVLAFRAHPGGSIAVGVATEIGMARKHDVPVIELPCGFLGRALSVEETREFLSEGGQR